MVSERMRFVQRMRVPIGFIFGVLFFIFAEANISIAFIGIAISGTGVLIRGWAAGHIRKNQNLAVSGPYSHTRNPLYLGSFLMGLGLTLGFGAWWFPLVFVLLFLGLYIPVMRAEIDDLKSLFGEQFTMYAANVPLFLPRISPWNRSEVAFDWSLFVRYREYRAAMGIALAWSFLLSKPYLLSLIKSFFEI